MHVSFNCPCCGQHLEGNLPARPRSLKCPKCRLEVLPPGSDSRPSRLTGWFFALNKQQQICAGSLILISGLAIGLVALTYGDDSSPGSMESDEFIAETSPAPFTSDSPATAVDESGRQAVISREQSEREATLNSNGGSPPQTQASDSATTQDVADEPDPSKTRLETFVARAEPEPETRRQTNPAPTQPSVPSARRSGSEPNSNKEPRWPRLAAVVKNARWPAPTLTDASFRKWQTFIRPTAAELKWRDIRWHTELEDAAAEARRLQRPILLWTMNGHPCGET